MNLINRFACLVLLLSSSAWAEIYETTDSEGNTVFTDMPKGEADVVELPEANIADSVKPTPRQETESRPAPRPQPAPGPGPGSESQEDDDVYIIGGENYERREEKAAREKRKEMGDKVPHAEPVQGGPRAPHPVRQHR